MTPLVKLAVGACIVIGVTTYMAYVGASASWQYYVTADECLAHAEKFAGSRLRVSGVVQPGSLQVSPQRTEAKFRLQGQTGTLHVICAGPLPDNLDEAMEVVVEGRYEDGGLIRGDKLLTRCASKYESGSTPGEEPQARNRSRKGRYFSWKLRGSGTFFGVAVSASGCECPPKNEPAPGA